jgi:hypothetical protein
MACRVVHCKKEHFDVYIGRPSKWGNPFVIGKDGTREEVVAKYKEWFYANKLLFIDDIFSLRDKVLGCWCHPHPCHGDVIAEVVNGINWDTSHDI